MTENNTFVGSDVTPENIITRMAELAKLKPEQMDAGVYRESPDYIAYDEFKNLPSWCTKYEVERIITETMVGGGVADIINYETSHIALVEANDSDRLGGAALLANGFDKKDMAPKTEILAFGADSNMDEGTINETLLEAVAKRICDLSKKFAAEMIEWTGTGAISTYEPCVEFAVSSDTLPRIEAMSMHTDIHKLIRQLQIMSDGKTSMGHRYNQKMEKLGVVRNHILKTQADHPIAEVIDEWGKLKRAGDDLMAGEESVYKDAQKTAKAALILFEGLLEGVRQSRDHLYPAKSKENLVVYNFTENADDSIDLSVRSEGSLNVEGTAEFKPPSATNKLATFAFRNCTKGSGAMSVLAAEILRKASQGEWFSSKTQ